MSLALQVPAQNPDMQPKGALGKATTCFQPSFAEAFPTWSKAPFRKHRGGWAMPDAVPTSANRVVACWGHNSLHVFFPGQPHRVRHRRGHWETNFHHTQTHTHPADDIYLRCPMTIIRSLSPKSCISWIWTKVPIW